MLLFQKSQLKKSQNCGLETSFNAVLGDVSQAVSSSQALEDLFFRFLLENECKA